MKFSMTGQEKVTFNTGDCLIEVTTLISLIVQALCFVLLFFRFYTKFCVRYYS